ncbi:hypothetical protein MLD38_025186 [Melastoma candidum]|uniref:Uncharacterized protein n=1 Tax=Melastoma candidum TaxID=119954 RepID=A0ACB9NXF4_9MYRT|nr:hypothetical protein MLD38_025186 [Melastoma candidum]
MDNRRPPMSDHILHRHEPQQSGVEAEATKSSCDLPLDDKALDAVAQVRTEVNRLAEKVATLEGVFRHGNEAAERELSILTEMLMVQLLKLDSIVTDDGEARVLRGVEVRRVQSIVDRLDNLKEANLGSCSSDTGLAVGTTAGDGSTRVTYDWVQFD